jgi:hypothetical protein
MLSVGVLIGNGESRKGFDLNILKNYDINTWGCNALYRDFTPDVLVSVDVEMIDEILKKYYKHTFIYNHKVNGKHALQILNSEIIGTWRGWDAGSTALDCMISNNKDMKKVFMLGIDLFSINGNVNNMYKDSNNYLKSNVRGEYATIWLPHFITVMIEHPLIEFYRVNAFGDVKVFNVVYEIKQLIVNMLKEKQSVAHIYKHIKHIYKLPLIENELNILQYKDLESIVMDSNDKRNKPTNLNYTEFLQYLQGYLTR